MTYTRYNRCKCNIILLIEPILIKTKFSLSTHIKESLCCIFWQLNILA